MVSEKSVNRQLKRIGFKRTGWGRGELSELHKVLLPEEVIYECVNGVYEGGFALLVATDVRVLLIDKKLLNFLTVEDLRFDMINEIDYSHRLIGAHISISTGSKNLQFTSYNQPRLRKLINHVQHCMAEYKQRQSSHQEDQSSHLEKINKQLQDYLVAQQHHQVQLQQIQAAQQAGVAPPPMPDPVRPSNELSDFLFAQSLMKQYEQGQQTAQAPPVAEVPAVPADTQLSEMYADGIKEVFGERQDQATRVAAPQAQVTAASVIAPSQQHQHRVALPTIPTIPNPLDLNPMRIASAKLPMALRNRKFGRPSFHEHSQAHLVPGTQDAAVATR